MDSLNDTQHIQTPRSAYWLRLQISDSRQVDICVKRTAIIGRSSREQQVDIDLSDDGGYRLGVSRYHVRFDAYQNRLTISDMDSANGTALNGKMLTPHRDYVVQPGDELSLGRMTLHVLDIYPAEVNA